VFSWCQRRIGSQEDYTVKKHREGDQLDRSKDDRRDAFTIADLSRTGKFTETQLQHGIYAELREYISLHYRLRRQICREKQYIWNSIGQLFPELWMVFKDYSGQTARALLRTCAAASEIRTMNEEEFIARVRKGFEGYRLYQSRLRKVFQLAKTSVGVKHGIQGLQLALTLHIETLTWLQKRQGQVLEAIETSFCLSLRPSICYPSKGLASFLERPSWQRSVTLNDIEMRVSWSS